MGIVAPVWATPEGSTAGATPDGSPGPSLYCVMIVKTVDAQTRAKTGISELLRE